MESGEELPLFEIKLEDEIFIPNKRVRQMTKEELLQNMEEQKSKSTERSTKTSLNNTWKSCHWCQDTGETRKIEEIPKEDLNELLKHFYWEIRKRMEKISSLAAFGRVNVDLTVTCLETKLGSR